MLSARAPDSNGRIAYIDGLRAIAVLSVVIFHAALHFPNRPLVIPFLSWQHLVFEGSHGVDLFFVLSGFCLSYPILRRLHAHGAADFDVYRYFAKRLVRIVPPYYLAIVLFWATGLAMAPFGAADLVKQMLFLDLHTAFLNGSFWTLCVEFRWYFFFPIALVLWVRAPRAFLALACTTSVAYSLTIFHFLTDVATLMPFMLGIVAAHLEINDRPLMRWIEVFIAAAVAFGLLFEFYRAVDALFFSQTNPGWQIAAFLCVVASARPAARRVLSWRPLVSIGTASYSIYLIHEPVIVFVESHMQAGPLLAPAAAAIAIGAGLVFWLVWERMWTNGPVKDRAVRSAESACAFAGARLQIPRNIQMGRPFVAAVARKLEPAPQSAAALAARAI